MVSLWTLLDHRDLRVLSRVWCVLGEYSSGVEKEEIESVL